MKPRIREIIVVEGRDDESAIKQAVDAQVIKTHGFGIARKTWELIEKAYEDRGIIIFTDPDFAGEKIRRRLKEKFPAAKEAFLAREDAAKAGDIGIENARPEAIVEALEKARCTKLEAAEALFTKQDMMADGLSGSSGAFQRREAVGRILGIGGGNTLTFLNKLNNFGITKEDYYEALRTIDNK